MKALTVSCASLSQVLPLCPCLHHYKKFKKSKGYLNRQNVCHIVCFVMGERKKGKGLLWSPCRFLRWRQNTSQKQPVIVMQLKERFLNARQLNWRLTALGRVIIRRPDVIWGRQLKAVLLAARSCGWSSHRVDAVNVSFRYANGKWVCSQLDRFRLNGCTRCTHPVFHQPVSSRRNYHENYSGLSLLHSHVYLPYVQICCSL